MAAVPLFCDTNMAAVTTCENTLSLSVYIFFSSPLPNPFPPPPPPSTQVYYGSGGWSIFYGFQDNEMKRCQGLTLHKMDQVEKKFSPISHVTVNDIKFPYFSLG